MGSVEEIEQAVSELPPEELRRFREWFAAFAEDVWHRQIERDLSSGRLDGLVEEARTEYRSGSTRECPRFPMGLE